MSETLAAFRARVPSRPHHPALVSEGTTLTYRELDQASSVLAGRLAWAGARPGTTVVLNLPQGLAVLVGMIATLRCGATWVVVEPGQPGARLDAVLTSTDQPVAVVLHEGRDDPPPAVTVSSGGAPFVLAYHRPPEPGSEPLVEPVHAAPAHLAYVVLTSGTTGVPKAIAISRRNLDTCVAGRTRFYGQTPVFLPAMSVSFDGVLGVLFATLAVGGTVVLPGGRELVNARAVARLAATHLVTHLYAVPSYYQALLDHAQELPATLHRTVLGGEVLPPTLVDRHQAALPRTGLVNEYGPSEATVSSTAHRVEEPTPARVPVGRPFSTVEVQVLDSGLQPTPREQVGELYIQGEQVGRGYVGAAAATAERFVADPYRPGSRMYRTGDLASVRADGALEFHGRTDHQVKVRGIRIELVEVDHVVQRHPGVRQAVVVHSVEIGLVAFVVPTDPQSPPSPDELRAHCARHLVVQAVPARFVRLDHVPTTHTGKADRSALASRAGEPDTGADWSGWNELEQAVAEEWAAVLRHSDAGLRDAFWQSGGTSLKLVELHERFEARWPGALRIGELFDLHTIEDQASAIRDRRHAGDDPPPGDFRIEV
ncbi:peptide synthetase [Actinoalloteichus sp. AHMU CJ021]|uniref:non-ribosomal peptide synthetase n=1 Tax=Actinoalloteichus sp. AHMU CJ021 TaxID=2072503 RepID=UPI000CA0256F|nr:peptide synthetase [Actinoalloteichus sp. AHMU CJ021]